MRALDRVVYDLEMLGCSPRGNDERGYMALCPAHADRTPSLHVTQGQKGCLVKCFAGCTLEALLDALGRTKAELFDDYDETAYARTR